MLMFFWYFHLFMERAYTDDISVTGCLRKHPDVRYRAISNNKYVISCEEPREDPISVFNHSHLYESQVKWFWKSSDGGSIVTLSNESTNPTLQGNSLWFKPINVQHSGTYICMKRGDISPCINIVIAVETNITAKCSTHSRSDIDLFVEQGISIDCPWKECFANSQDSSVKWYKNGIQMKLQKKKRPSLKFYQDKIVFGSVYDKDNGIYICDYMLTEYGTQWKMRTLLNIHVISKDTFYPPEILNPSNGTVLEVETDQPTELECRAQFGFEKNASSSLQWYRETMKSKQLIHQIWYGKEVSESKYSKRKS